MGELIKNLNYGLSKAFETEKFSELLEDAARRLGRENKFTQKTSFAPSGIGYGSGTCPRYWYYAFNGAEYEYDNTPLQIANMSSGTVAGERIAKLFEQAGILVEAERKVEHEDPPIGGFIDAVVNWQGEEMLVEVKTTRENTWNYRMTKMTVPGYQLLQLLIYMRVEGKDKGFFFTENKNTHEVFVLPVKMTEERAKLVDDVFDWMRKVKDNADNGELPKRPFTPKSKECKSCPVWSTCWEGYKRGTVNGTDPNPGTIDLPALEIPK